MNDLFTYLVKSSLILTAFYIIYWLLLRKEIYLTQSRFYLVSCVILSFLIPFFSININNTYNKEIPAPISGIASVQQYLNVDKQLKTNYYILDNPALRSGTTENLSYSKILLYVYLCGVALFLIILIISLLNIIKLITTHKIRKQNGYKLILVNRTLNPFSFMNYIFLNKKDLSETDFKNIIEHEAIHVQQRHSVDILIVEFFKIFLWFNPVIWLLKKSLKSVHEYLADKNAIKNGCDMVEYQSSVLKQFISTRSFALSNSFNVNSIKKRLSMMTINKPSKWAKAKITGTFVLVAVIIVLLTCNFVVIKKAKVESYYKNGNKRFEAETKDGKLYGPFTCWDSLNNVYFKGSFNEKGNIDGIESAYENGVKRAEYYYQNDTLRYFLSSWYENGKSDETFLRDENDTSKKLLRYYESGAKYEEIEYSFFEKGKSKLFLWNENGEVAFSGYYNEYLLYSDNSTQPFSGSINILYKNGRKARECTFKDGQPVGVESEWYNNGNLRTEINHISITQKSADEYKIRTNVKNWKTNGEGTIVGDLTYGESRIGYFTPFALEQESFLTYSLHGHWYKDLIPNIKKELENIKK